jgi:hypothetical protein
MNIQYSLVHLKNLAALVAIAGAEPMRIVKILRNAYVDQAKYVDRLPGAMNLMKRMALSLEESELFKSAASNGVTHFRGEDQFRTVMENVKKSMTPLALDASLPGKLLSKGPFTTVIFDVMDRAGKMALYEQLVEKGLTPRMAADWTNYYLIDYTSKNLDPDFKKFASALMPFVSWNVQNALLHIPNMIENPRKYAMIYYLRHYLPNTVWKSNTTFAGSEVPEALADAVPLPPRFGDSQGNQTFVHLDLPWDKYIRLANNTIIKSPTNMLLWKTELARFLLNKTYYAGLLKDAMDPTSRKRLEKQTLSESLFGTEKRGGIVQDALWGIYPLSKNLSRAANTWMEIGSWKDMSPAVVDLIIGRSQQVSPAGRIQK